MSAKMSAVEDIRKLARSLKGLIALADELESVGSLEQAMAESKGRAEALIKQEREARAKKEEAAKELADIEEKAATVKQAADDYAAQTKARVSAELADQRREFDEAKAEAHKKLQDEAERAKLSLKEIQMEHDAIAGLIAEKKAHLDSLNAEVNALKAKFK